MSVRELARDQIIELKEHILCDVLERTQNRTPLYGELFEADELISDEDVFAEFSGTCFSEDDFFCSCGN